MLEDAKIENTNQLEFAVFCIENIAIRLEKNAEEIYKMLTEESNILSGYQKCPEAMASTPRAIPPAQRAAPSPRASAMVLQAPNSPA